MFILQTVILNRWKSKIKSILTDEQYKKYQDMRKKDNAKKKKKAK